MSNNHATGAAAPTTHQLETVEFHGDTIYVVEHNNEPYVPIRGIVENMGLGWKTQYRKLQSTRIKSTVVKMTTVAQDGKPRQTICIPVRKLPIFLAGINPNKVKNSLRAKIIAYQNECDDVLHNYWTTGHASNHRQNKQHSQPRLADLAEQFQQTSLALNSPELDDAQRWELASKITAALFGCDAAYLLGSGEVQVYKNNLRPTAVRGKYTGSLAITEQTESGLQLSYHAYLGFAEECCVVAAGLGASEVELYRDFGRWFKQSFDHEAPSLELFRSRMSQHHRRISLAGQPWYLGISQQGSELEVQV